MKFLYFLAHLAYMPKILSFQMAHHTHTEKYRCTQTHVHQTQIQISFLHFTLLDHLAYMPKILILHLAHQTHIQIHTDTCTHTDADTIFTFWLIWHTWQRYLAYHRLTHAQILTCTHIDTHIYRDTDTQIQIH